MEEGKVDCTSSPVVIETVEVTGVIFLVTVGDVSLVFSTVVSVEVGDVIVSDVVGNVLLPLDGEKFLSLEVGVVNIPDVVAGVWLTLAGDEVVVSPEEDVSWGVPAVRVCPRGDDEGVDVVTSVMVVL